MGKLAVTMPARRGSGEGVSFVTCRLCKHPFRSITGAHLLKDGYESEHPILTYLAEYGLTAYRCAETRRLHRQSQLATLVRKGIRWSRERVTREIRAIAKAGGRLNCVSILPRHNTLYFMAGKLFGNWENALVAAGFAPEKIRLQRRWSREAVVRALRREHREGRNMASSAVAKRDEGLAQAATRYFGTWRRALRAAGLQPDRVIRKPHWTRLKVIAAIRKLGIVRARDVAPENRKIVQAAVRHFGGWVRALRAAGLRHPGYFRIWTREKILEEIRGRAGQGKSIRHSDMAAAEKGCVQAALREYGSWPAAIEAAGCEVPSRVRKWTRERILETIRSRAREKLPLTASAVARTFAGCPPAAIREFGGWRAAVEAAGATYPERALKWNRETILEVIRSHARRGRPVSGMAAERELGGCTGAARAQFGSWRAAVEAAGLTYPERSLKWSRDAVLGTLRSRAARGASLRSTVMQREQAGCLSAAVRIFGSWRAALEAAGVPYPALAWKWSQRKILEAIRLTARKGLSPTVEAVERDNRGCAPAARREFGSWRSAVESAGCIYSRTPRSERAGEYHRVSKPNGA